MSNAQLHSCTQKSWHPRICVCMHVFITPSITKQMNGPSVPSCAQITRINTTKTQRIHYGRPESYIRLWLLWIFIVQPTVQYVYTLHKLIMQSNNAYGKKRKAANRQKIHTNRIDTEGTQYTGPERRKKAPQRVAPNPTFQFSNRNKRADHFGCVHYSFLCETLPHSREQQANTCAKWAACVRPPGTDVRNVTQSCTYGLQTHSTFPELVVVCRLSVSPSVCALGACRVNAIREIIVLEFALENGENIKSRQWMWPTNIFSFFERHEKHALYCIIVFSNFNISYIHSPVDTHDAFVYMLSVCQRETVSIFSPYILVNGWCHFIRRFRQVYWML